VIKTPRLEIYPERVGQNADSVIGLCHSHGVMAACVTKVVAAHPAVARAMSDAGADMLADSRIGNLMSLRSQGLRGPFLLLRLPAFSEVDEVVRAADISLNSGLPALKKLSEAARAQGRKHKVIIMVDLGDLREGIWPDMAVTLVKAAKDLPALEIIGLGTNLACYGGVLATVENMTRLVQIRGHCRRETGLELGTLSGGNSSGLPLLSSGKMPSEINHFRIGEAIILGCNSVDRSPLPNTRQDTMIGIAEVIEMERKPSVPIGDRGQDAFGGSRKFPDLGIRRRAICNIGRQDVAIEGVFPLDPGIKVLGGSSDHLLLDVEDAANPITLGTEISFFPSYGALLALSTSPYVEKIVIRGR